MDSSDTWSLRAVWDLGVCVMSFVNTEDCALRRAALQESETGETPAITEAAGSRVWRRKYLHGLYRETLASYRDPTSDWMTKFSRKTLQNIWENYRNA